MSTHKLNQRLIIIIFSAIILVLLGLVAYYSAQYYRLSHSAGPGEAARLTKKVGRLIQLPAGEEPSIATVTNTSKLTNQPFFAKAKEGDKVFIYTKAKQAIIYRPGTNQIINVGPISLGEETPAAAATTPSPAP